ncbi:MAG: 4Fe-4S dicluster domain-containing protein, partial [Anaerolineales bacterium]|nr:4Fe-4S dicluster domain-containing protein [Anaerolineales bacterium]
ERQQLHVIAVPCDGIRAGAGKDSPNGHDQLQERCQQCEQRQPVISDTWIEVDTPAPEPVAIEPQVTAGGLLAPADLDARPPAERLAYWVSQFDRCIRCYACRQACPVCDCPTCLYERDDSLWTGMQIEVDQKRAFHLGRAFHLAGRCVGCDECQRACPMDIPIRLLNQKLAEELQNAFGFQAGLEAVPSPITTVLGEERAA